MIKILLGPTEYRLVNNSKNIKESPFGYENRNSLWSEGMNKFLWKHCINDLHPEGYTRGSGCHVDGMSHLFTGTWCAPDKETFEDSRSDTETWERGKV